MSTEGPTSPPAGEGPTRVEGPPDGGARAEAASVEGLPAEAAQKPKKKRRKKAEENAVKLRRIVKRFGAKLAVDDLTLEIPKGDVYGLIGPNGAGKTTTFSMMAGFLKPTEGYVEVLGYSPDSTAQLKSKLGVLPQDSLLPANDFVGEFLIHMARLQGIAANRASTVAREALEEVQGRDWWGLRCGALSHGMAKRVALAQAFLGDPEVVLLDEPTEGLDPRIAHEVRDLVKSRKGKCTIIISSHNLHELEEICDAAAILDRGKLVAAGTMDELTAASEEVHVRVAPPKGTSRRDLVLPMEQLRSVPGVTLVELDDDKLDVALYFDRSISDAETVIGAALRALLDAQVRISGVEKGRGLEQRVLELTDE